MSFCAICDNRCVSVLMGPLICACSGKQCSASWKLICPWTGWQQQGGVAGGVCFWLVTHPSVAVLAATCGGVGSCEPCAISSIGSQCLPGQAPSSGAGLQQDRRAARGRSGSQQQPAAGYSCHSPTAVGRRGCHRPGKLHPSQQPNLMSR